MKHILCYGDSNTYGFDPVAGKRLPRSERWAGVMHHELGADYEVIEEGLGSRTTIWDDPLFGYKNGKDYLIPCLESHAPLDLIILFLGTNDLKRYFALSPAEIAGSVGVLIEIILRSEAGPDGSAPCVLLLSPPPVGVLTGYKTLYEGAEVKSRKLAIHYRRVARAYGCAFLDTSTVVTPNDVDGIHMVKSEHVKLGRALATMVRSIFESSPAAEPQQEDTYSA